MRPFLLGWVLALATFVLAAVLGWIALGKDLRAAPRPEQPPAGRDW
jgi:hypothetical protein